MVERRAQRDRNPKSEKRDADTEVWRVPVPANGTAAVIVTFDTRI